MWPGPTHRPAKGPPSRHALGLRDTHMGSSVQQQEKDPGRGPAGPGKQIQGLSLGGGVASDMPPTLQAAGPALMDLAR